jgi:ABC-type polysaccharide/polyol phosphate transport system ATPase subunit
MADDVVVEVNNVSKCYKIYNSPRDRFKQLLFGSKKKFYHEFWALNPVSFTIEKGKAFGIIGRNGSGKSTLLQLICETLSPSTGSITVHGRIAALLELGAGFNPEFSGRENVYLNGAILGFTKKQIDEKFADIIKFADIGDFINQPVKNYSSGMFVRLAFAVQACSDPNVLIVDEALSVGDIFFQLKCHARMEELLQRGTVIIFVSHDMSAIRKYCNTVLLLNKGERLFLGPADEAVERYYQLDQSYSKSQEEKNPQYLSNSEIIRMNAGLELLPSSSQIKDWPADNKFLDLSQAVVIGNERVARCVRVALCDSAGQPKSIFQVGEIACFFYEYEILQDIDVPIGSVLITDRMNADIHGKTSLQYTEPAPSSIKPGARIRFRQTIELAITPGEYVFQIGLTTILPEFYSQVLKMDHHQINAHLKEVLRVRTCGRFSVIQKTEGVRLPFYGYADLKGDMQLEVI